ncbi:bis(5'-nucleosyl)-tetraphosphatase (symmetrical) YqeK [Paenibacillus sp. GSMTC-2017]|uniref:bis(5'-nucleosyl)-tetraphosphatase (symmetrical) YqeK n=1 Tax=Paenibacillus sp. GSMTC-2017 TaxID=2794350 RepID=UPI0018D752FE|nr:bis(5'-nucleosyl)-tetraphosphatase (symmetrical) YqeK [Paenibacillus sp. GSMTC-2017]MBH5317020.1 bis(5'-nucleosyl)-tetraphosphatase (symmetrical) YqeK [Paenibacillus sp. GSMTC-2017]
MDRTSMIERVRAEMPEKRWKHTEGVMATAIILANRYGEDAKRAELAAILHDVAKFWPTVRQGNVIRDNNLPIDVLNYDKELWHASVGAWVAEHEFGVTDVGVLDAIRYHTSGRRGMTKLEKIVWLADYIEPGRDFPGVDHVRAISEVNLEEAILAGLDGTLSFLIAKGVRIYPLTIEARNSLIEEIKGG